MFPEEDSVLRPLSTARPPYVPAAVTHPDPPTPVVDWSVGTRPRPSTTQRSARREFSYGHLFILTKTFPPAPRHQRMTGVKSDTGLRD